jgi:hypothetical protein
MIIYKKGVENGVADALSRRVHTSANLMVVSACRPKCLSEVANSYELDSHASGIISKLLLDPSVVPQSTYVDGLLRYKNKLWLGNQPSLHTKIIAAMHNSAIGGHLGIFVTLRKLKNYFAWTGMKASIHSFVSACLTCQQAKPDRAKYPDLLQPLPIPQGAWQIISLDFVEGLPKFANMDTILVVEDKFSKYNNFLALSHPFSAFSVAKLFLSNIYKLHGMPTFIISDRDKIFMS